MGGHPTFAGTPPDDDVAPIPDVRATVLEPQGFAEFGLDDAARLMEHVGWKSAKVIGVSFGGMVAQEFVLRHPRRVERLVLACTSPGGAGGAAPAT